MIGAYELIEQEVTLQLVQLITPTKSNETIISVVFNEYSFNPKIS